MKTKNGEGLYAGVQETMRKFAEGEPDQVPILKAFLSDMHALVYLKEKVEDLLDRHKLDPYDAEKPAP